MHTPNIRFILSALVVTLALSAPAQAQTSDSASSAATWNGSFWPSLTFAKLTGGPAEPATHSLERYGVQTGLGSDTRQSFWMDARDIAIVYHDGERDLFTLNRRALARYNQRSDARLDNGRLRLTGSYGVFRQASGGFDYLYSPLKVTGGTNALYTGGNVGYLGRFNDATVDPAFAVTRTSYGTGVQLKPAMFNQKATFGLTYRGLTRSGRSPDSLVMGGSDVLGTDADRRAKLRWHGYESSVDETTNTLTLNAAVRPVPGVNVQYELGYERFRNNATAMTFAGIAAGVGIPLAATTAEAGAAGAVALGSADVQAHFVADTNLVRQSLVASAGNRNLFVSTGGAWSQLTQESFTTRQVSEGYGQGEIGTTHFFVNLASRPSPRFGAEAYVRRSAIDRDIDTYSLSTRTNAVTQWTYGAEFDARSADGRLSITPGWTRRTAERDLEFNSIVQVRSLYRADSESDEFFVRARWKLAPRVTLRVTPSFLRADKTALPTEPTKANKVNVALAYANATGAYAVSGYYTRRTRQNDTLSFTGSDGGVAQQNREGALDQFGVAGTMMASEATTVYWNYAWSRDEYSSTFFGTTARRYDASPVFYVRDAGLTSRLASHAFTIGADVLPLERVQYGVSYSATRTSGDIATGSVLAALPTLDGRIDNWYHSASLRIEGDLGRSLKLGVSYLFDYYSNASYTALSGGLHTLVASLGYRF